MANQLTDNQGQPLSGFTAQEEQVGAAFGLDANWAAQSYWDRNPFATNASAQPGEAGFYAAAPGGAPSTLGQRKVVDAFVHLTTMGPDQINALQHRLFDAGYYDASFYSPKGPRVRWGDLDTATINAYSSVIKESMRYQGSKTPDDLLAEGAAQGFGKDMQQQQTPKPPPLTIQLTDSNDLMAIANATARKLLGRKLTDAELRNYVDTFHTMEASAQQAKYNAEYSQGYDADSGTFRGPGGTVTAPPSADAYAQTLLAQQNPQDVRNVEMEHGYDVANQVLHGGPNG